MPQHVLWWASAAFLGVAMVDLVDQVASTFVTGRTSERIMASLRIRIWAQLQRLSLDYYEREMAGRIMTRMTTDVDQFETLIENGLLQAMVSLVTFVGVGVALLLMDLELALWTLTVVVPLAFATVVFRRITNRLYDVVREALAVVNADFQESLSGIREAQAFVHEEPTIERFHRLGRRYYDGRARAQRTIATYFPFVLFLSAIADVIVLGIGAHLIEQGRLTTGVLIAFLLYLDDVLLADPAAVAGLRLLAADAGLDRPDRRADAACARSRRTPSTRCRSARCAASWRWTTSTSPTPSPRSAAEERGPADAVPDRRRTSYAGSRRRRCAASTCTSRRTRPSRSSARPEQASRRCSS